MEATPSKNTMKSTALKEKTTYKSEKRDKFADLVVADGFRETPLPNADKYIQAGYKATNRKVAKKNAQKLKKHPKVQERVKTWKDMLGEIPDSALLSKLLETALSEDKRASLSAIDTILKLKDRYPAGKLKVTQYEEELKQLE